MTEPRMNRRTGRRRPSRHPPHAPRLRVARRHRAPPGPPLRGGRVLGGHRVARRAGVDRGRQPLPRAPAVQGQRRRASAQEIAEAVESCGGDMNAFTGQEITAYYVRVPDRYLDLALDILSDIVWSPALRPDEVESERQVILEEIQMRDDTPDDLVHDVFAGALFPRAPARSRDLGFAGDDQRGDARPDRRVPRRALPPVERRRRGRRQRRPRRRRRACWTAVLPATAGDPSRRGSTAPTRGTPDAFARVDRPLEQSHVVLGAPRPAARRPRPVRAGGRRPGARRRHELAPLPGGAREARPGLLGVLLPQRVRGDRRAGGVLRHRARARRGDARRRARPSSTASSPTVACPSVSSIGAKGHLTGSLALSLESSSSRMNRIGRAELTMGEIPSLDWVVEQVDAVTRRRRRPRDRPGARRRRTHARAGGSPRYAALT